MQKLFKIFLNDADWTKIQSGLRPGSDVEIRIRIRIQDQGCHDGRQKRKKWRISFLKSRVSDPHGFNADPDTDPDPVFFLIADPGFDDLKLEKIYSWKFNFDFPDKKIAIYLSLGLHKGCPSFQP